MPFVPATAMAFDRTATRAKGEALYEDLKEKLRSVTSVHADETSWRQDGIGHYVWYAGNDDLAVFHIDRHRSSKVAQSILGDKFGGVLNTDGYAAYNAVNAKDRQSCLAHLIRKAEEIKKEILFKKPHFQDQQAIRFCDSIRNCSGRLVKSTATPMITIYSQELVRPGGAAYSLLNTICLTQLSDKNAETFRKRLLDPKKEYRAYLLFSNILMSSQQTIRPSSLSGIW